jgi:hypothetical protein
LLSEASGDSFVPGTLCMTNSSRRRRAHGRGFNSDSLSSRLNPRCGLVIRAFECHWSMSATSSVPIAIDSDRQTKSSRYSRPNRLTLAICKYPGEELFLAAPNCCGALHPATPLLVPGRGHAIINVCFDSHGRDPAHDKQR